MMDAKALLDMLKNKDLMAGQLMSDLDTCEKNMQAFEKLERLYAESPETVSATKAMAACAKSIRHLNEVNRRLIMLMVVYAAGDNFSSDSARLLMKMGRGDEALREMFRQKMG
ncbi:MAG: hypothetical protein ACRCUB_16800 [Plesiomonas shigelloides]